MFPRSERVVLAWRVMWTAGAIAAGLATSPLVAQDSGRAPEPQEVTLHTKDGIALGATFYPAGEGERDEIVPLVLLHDYQESRAVFDDLARRLQAAGADARGGRAPRAILTVDLRGHGESKTARTRGGGEIELEPKDLGQADFEAMVLSDMEAVRKFLVAKNNAGQLNLNQLGLIGAGMGANVALLWAANDWSVAPLPRVKQGQDVKALVLISPIWSFRGLPLVRAVKHPAIQRELSVFIAFGEDDRKSDKDAKTIHKNLERFHPEPPRDQIAERKDLYLVGLPTSLKGAELLTKRQFRLAPDVDEFIERRLGRKDFRWFDRSLD